MAIFNNARLVKSDIWDKLTLRKLKTWCKENKIEQAILSTTAGVDPKIEKYLSEQLDYLRLDEHTKLPFKNKYKTPKTLGRDRLAGIAGAIDLFPDKNCLVIDAGTCITYDLLTEQGDYLGGNISPGVEMRFRAMNAFTANLPLVKRRTLKVPYGYNTITALRAGGQIGAVMEMQGFINTYKEKFGNLNVIITGGDAKFFANHLKTKIFVNNHLVLIGLNKILRHNVRESD